jgi:riboflavin kinase / FMN adenylyltransferase
MKIHYNLEELRGIKNPVVTTGSFDGVHIGHKAIIRRLKKLAKDIGGETVLITFHPHPRRVLYPDAEGKDLLMINTQREKIWLMEKTGLDHLMIVDFTPEFSRISSHDFIENVLVGILGVKIVVVGFNHQFGYRREGDFEYLYKLGHIHGFEVEEIPEQDIQNESVSSTKIRQALLQGNIQRANAYLDHYYIIKTELSVNNENGPGVNGYEFYHSPVGENVKLIPPNGVYAVNVEGEGFFEKGMAVITGWGIVNSFVSPELYIGLHILDFEENMEGKEVTVYFHKRIRNGFESKSGAFTEKLLQRDLQEISDLIY